MILHWHAATVTLHKYAQLKIGKPTKTCRDEMSLVDRHDLGILLILRIVFIFFHESDIFLPVNGNEYNACASFLIA